MPAQKDTILGQLAVQRGYLTREQIDQALELQRKMHDELGMDQPLEQVLVAKHWLTPDQAHELRNAAAVQTGEARLVAGYEAISKLGQGGMGAVYKARRVGTEEYVALKVLPPSLADEERIARFRRESAIVRELDHENIVACVEFGFDKRRKVHFCALELVEGEDLGKRITRVGRFTEDEALSITSQMAMALQHAYFNGLVHRDVKPENVMVTADGTAKLLDLGLARQASQEATRLTESGMFVGSPYYASPEQAMGQKEVDTRSDIYSLGATLYHMVTGKPPFEGTTALAILQKHVNEKLPWPAEVNPELSDGLCTVVAKMMSKNPDDRYQTPNELNQDLDLLMEGEEPEVAEAVLRRSSLALPAIRPRRRRRPASRPRAARDRDRKHRRPAERPRAEARPERKKRESARAHRKPPEQSKPPERHEGPSAAREALRKLSVHAMQAVRAMQPVWERLPRRARIAIPIAAGVLVVVLLVLLIFSGGEPDQPGSGPAPSGDSSRAAEGELTQQPAAVGAGRPVGDTRKVPAPAPATDTRKPASPPGPPKRTAAA
ncbi:MAG: serine/threonine protein kinase, partial [Planctomycetota bacterium]